MRSFDVHCNETRRLIRKVYEAVQRRLDVFAGSEEYGMRYRKVQHHKGDIRRTVELSGIQSGEAARQHIISDLKKE